MKRAGTPRVNGNRRSGSREIACASTHYAMLVATKYETGSMTNECSLFAYDAHVCAARDGVGEPTMSRSRFATGADVSCETRAKLHQLCDQSRRAGVTQITYCWRRASTATPRSHAPAPVRRADNASQPAACCAPAAPSTQRATP